MSPHSKHLQCKFEIRFFKENQRVGKYGPKTYPAFDSMVQILYFEVSLTPCMLPIFKKKSWRDITFYRRFMCISDYTFR